MIQYGLAEDIDLRVKEIIGKLNRKEKKVGSNLYP
jgi:hypothetical protein